MKNSVRNVRNQRGATRPTKELWVKNLSGALRMGSAAGLLIVAIVLSYQGYLLLNQPIQEIQLSGDFDQSWTSQIERKLSSYAGQGLLDIDLENVRATLESTAWVSSAQISRQWPATLAVRIEQYRLVARWGDQGYVSDAGELVQGYAVSEALPLLQSVAGQPQAMLDQYRALSQAMSQVGLALDELHESRSGDLELVLNNGIRLKLGSKDLLNRMQRFVTLWQMDLHNQTEKIQQVDLRYVNGLAVQWRERAKRGAGIQLTGERYGELAGR